MPPDLNAGSFPGVKNEVKGYEPLALVVPDDKEWLCPIHYVYDYLPNDIKWLTPQPLSLDRIFTTSEHGPAVFDRFAENHVRLQTQAGRLPLHTGIEDFPQSKHWKISVEANEELLELFAQDQRCGEIMLSDTRSMIDLAKGQLEIGVLDTYGRYSIYMYALADKDRAPLLAQSMILIFIFDDVWENAAPNSMDFLCDDIVSRLKGHTPACLTDTPLQRKMNAIRDGFLEADEKEGNGGAETLQALIDFCYHSRPHDFDSTRAYLDYRRDDAAFDLILAGTKFSIRSRINQKTPTLQPFLRLCCDQITIANDLASYDKEQRDFDAGRIKSMINIVTVIQRIDHLSTPVAKAMAYARQLYIENELLLELHALKTRAELSAEEWMFVQAFLATAAGNLLNSVVISRYGGEDARV